MELFDAAAPRMGALRLVAGYAVPRYAVSQNSILQAAGNNQLARPVRRRADYQSAIGQITNRRYNAEHDTFLFTELLQLADSPGASRFIGPKNQPHGLEVVFASGLCLRSIPQAANRFALHGTMLAWTTSYAGLAQATAAAAHAGRASPSSS